MNNTFDIKRFWLLLQKDIKEYYIRFRYKIGVIFVVYAAIMLFTWIKGLISQGSQIDMDTRLEIMFYLTLVAMVSVPAILYGHVNHKRKGIDFAMLPASSFEKFLTMFVVATIITPILSAFCLLTVDTVLSYLPAIGVTANIFTTERITIGLLSELNSVLQTTTLFWIGDLIVISAVFLLGNMIFKSSKIGKTVLAVLLFWTITVIIIVTGGLISTDIIMSSSTKENVFLEALFTWFRDRTYIIRILLAVMYYSIIVLILFFTYRKIKTLQY